MGNVTWEIRISELNNRKSEIRIPNLNGINLTSLKLVPLLPDDVLRYDVP